MKRFCRLWTGCLVMSLILCLCNADSRAASEYTYQFTYYPGNHGTFNGSGMISVDNSRSHSSYQITESGSVIRVSGLKLGDVVSFSANEEGAVRLEEGSKYYARGIRQSGRDNSEALGNSAVIVKEDRDFVVAYGIAGNMIAYTVNYQDAAGNTLAPSRTYYGNIGDRPVIAFLYIEGYRPQAYNLTKTLSVNAAENVFTFVYTGASSSGGGGGGSSSGTDGGETGGGGVAGTEGAVGAPGAGSPAGGVNAGAEGTGGGTAGTEAGVPGGGEEGAGLPGEEAMADTEPEEPRELIDLDDEDVPLAGGDEEVAGRQPGFGMLTMAVFGILLIVIAAAAVIWYNQKRRKNEERA